MSIYGYTTRFAPPKTITFNQLPQDEAQFRSSRLGGRAIAGTLGTASGLLALVALVMALNMISALAATWSELLTLGLIATGVVAALVGLPIASALMQRAYPVEARRAVAFWLTAMAVVSLAAMFVAWRLEAPGVRDKTVKTHAAPLGTPAIRSRWMTTDIWRGTDGCTKMRTDYDGVICEEYSWKKGQAGVVEPPRGTVTEAQAGDWSPSGVLGVAGVGDGYLRRLAVLFLNLFAVAGAGILGRWAVLSTAETYRLGLSEASALPQPAAAAISAPASGGGASMSAIEVFNMWFGGRIRYDAQSRLAAAAIYGDYAQTCELNGYPPVSAKQFGGLLTSKAEGSGGRISKLRSNGNFYVGIAFASSPEVVDSDYGANGAGDNFGPARYRQ